MFRTKCNEINISLHFSSARFLFTSECPEQITRTRVSKTKRKLRKMSRSFEIYLYKHTYERKTISVLHVELNILNEQESNPIFADLKIYIHVSIFYLFKYFSPHFHPSVFCSDCNLLRCSF